MKDSIRIFVASTFVVFVNLNERISFMLLVALSTDYVLPRLRTKFGERAFSHAGPSAWNALPEDIRATSDSAVFRNQFKTHYFSLAFNAC